MACFWKTLAICHILLGYEADILGILTYSVGDQRQQALLIVAFVLYTISAILMSITKFAKHKLDIIIAIFVIIFLIVAAALLCAAVGIYGLDNEADPYPATLEISAAVLGVLGAIFLMVRVVCGKKNSSTSP